MKFETEGLNKDILHGRNKRTRKLYFGVRNIHHVEEPECAFGDDVVITVEELIERNMRKNVGKTITKEYII